VACRLGPRLACRRRLGLGCRGSGVSDRRLDVRGERSSSGVRGGGCSPLGLRRPCDRRLDVRSQGLSARPVLVAPVCHVPLPGEIQLRLSASVKIVRVIVPGAALESARHLPSPTLLPWCSLRAAAHRPEGDFSSVSRREVPYENRALAPKSAAHPRTSALCTVQNPDARGTAASSTVTVGKGASYNGVAHGAKPRCTRYIGLEHRAERRCTEARKPPKQGISGHRPRGRPSSLDVLTDRQVGAREQRLDRIQASTRD